MSRRVIVLAGLCASLAALASIDFGGPKAQRAPNWTLPAFGMVQRVVVARTGQASVQLRRGAAGWRVADTGAPADRYALEAIEAALAEPLGMDQQTQAERDDHARFGLGPHALVVSLETAQRTVQLAVGKVVDGRRTFVQPVDGPPDVIYRAKANLRGLFDRPPHTWPERRLFSVAYGDVASLRRVDGARPSWQLERAAPDAPWRWAGSPHPVSEQAAVSVVNSLVGTKVERFETEGAPFTPRTTLEGRTFGGDVFGLQIAGAPGGVLRVRRIGHEAVAQVPAWFGAFLDVQASGLRARRVVSLDPAEVTAVVTQGPRPVSIERQPDGGWRMRHPEARALDADRVARFISNLAGLRATGFAQSVPAGAFAEPWLVLRVRLRGDREVSVTFGATYAGSQARFVRVSGQEATGAVVNAAGLAGLLPTPADLSPQ